MSTLSDEDRARIAANLERGRQLKAAREAREKAQAEAEAAARKMPPPARPFSHAPTNIHPSFNYKPNFAPTTSVRPTPLHNHVNIQRADAQRDAAASHWNQPKPQSPRDINIRSVQADPSTFPAAKVEVKLELVPPNRLKANIIPFHSKVVEMIKTIPGYATGDYGKRLTIPMNEAKNLERMLKDCPLLQAKVDVPPKEVLDLLTTFEPEQVPENLNELLPQELLDKMFPFQRSGVRFVLERGGRVMVADEMGLGKTVQALAAARIYKAEWPLLVVTMSSIKHSWKNNIAKFFPYIKRITMLDKGSDPLPAERTSNTVVIISYDLMANRVQELVDACYQVIIFDESHLLKEKSAKRTKAAQKISNVANRVILLSGTPALSRPVELYSQISLIDPKLFPNFFKFAERYCGGRKSRFGYDTRGCTNSEELKSILLRRIMIRRIKSDVLKELPPKRREVIYLSGKTIDSRMATLQKIRQELEKNNVDFDRMASNGAGLSKQENENLIQYYRETGVAKVAAVCEHIMNNYFYEGADHRKVLIFAHHQVVMDSIQTEVSRKALRWIRIDGSTPQRDRGSLCDEFQNDPSVKVAILSIGAAGVGITLTAASVVIFAELTWNPGALVQAEDRAHRVGQEDSVYCQYLLAKGTADDYIWQLVQRKLDMLGQVELSSDTFRLAEKTHVKLDGTQQLDIRRYLAQGSSNEGTSHEHPRNGQSISMAASTSSNVQSTSAVANSGNRMQHAHTEFHKTTLPSNSKVKESVSLDDFNDEPQLMKKKKLSETIVIDDEDWTDDDEPPRKKAF